MKSFDRIPMSGSIGNEEAVIICDRVHKMVQRAQNNYRIGLNEENGLK